LKSDEIKKEKDPEPDPHPDPYFLFTDTDADPGGPKTLGSYGSGLAMSNQRSFKIESIRFPAFVPKKIEYIRF
jgi:hypothetical protein